MILELLFGTKEENSFGLEDWLGFFDNLEDEMNKIWNDWTHNGFDHSWKQEEAEAITAHFILKKISEFEVMSGKDGYVDGQGIHVGNFQPIFQVNVNRQVSYNRLFQILLFDAITHKDLIKKFKTYLYQEQMIIKILNNDIPNCISCCTNTFIQQKTFNNYELYANKHICTTRNGRTSIRFQFRISGILNKKEVIIQNYE